MGEAEKSVVWILGAGFSRSLGGPLLADMFDETRLAAVVRRLANHAHTALVREKLEAVGRIFAAVPDGRAAASWGDGEEFLERCRLAATPEESAPREAALDALSRRTSEWREQGGIVWPDQAIRPGQPGFGPDIDRAARTYLAGVCATFFDATETALGERWAPYLRWIRQLAPADTVISFNYDLTVEAAHAAQRATTSREALTVMLPGERPDACTTARLLKVHGSVNWRPTSEDWSSVEQSDFDAIVAGGNAPAILGPGPDKARLARTRFGTLWSQAETALKSASAIIFVGYRFPPSDAHARAAILGAIAKNERRHVALHPVLGPARTGKTQEDTERLQGMLDWATHPRTPSTTDAKEKTVSIRIERMWAEDFLSVFDRDRLLNPRRRDE